MGENGCYETSQYMTINICRVNPTDDVQQTLSKIRIYDVKHTYKGTVKYIKNALLPIGIYVTAFH